MDGRAVLAEAQAAPLPLDPLGGIVDDLWPGARLRSAALLPGGLSSVLHRLEVDGAAVSTLVLRQLIEEFGQDATIARREAQAMAAADTAGVPVPRVWWLDADGATLGRPALLLSFVPGRPVVADLVRAAGRDALARVVHALAATPTVGLDTLPHLNDLEAAMAWPSPSPATSAVVDAAALRGAVRATGAAVSSPRRLVHTDLHGGNVHWDGSEVTGVLDWSGVALGTPWMDEAYLWFDTCLAHGRDVGDALQAAVDRARPDAPPTAAQRRLWRGVALLRGLPDPTAWASAYRATGVAVDDATVVGRFVELVDGYLEEG